MYGTEQTCDIAWWSGVVCFLFCLPGTVEPGVSGRPGRGAATWVTDWLTDWFTADMVKALAIESYWEMLTRVGSGEWEESKDKSVMGWVSVDNEEWDGGTGDCEEQTGRRGCYHWRADGYMSVLRVTCSVHWPGCYFVIILSAQLEYMYLCFWCQEFILNTCGSWVWHCASVFEKIPNAESKTSFILAVLSLLPSEVNLVQTPLRLTMDAQLLLCYC